MTLTFLHWDHGWYNHLWFCFDLWKAPLFHALVPFISLLTGVVWTRFGLAFWPADLWTSRCSALCGAPLLWYLRFGGSSGLLGPYSFLHPSSPACMPIPGNACPPSPWVLVGIWTVFGATIPIFLQFIALNIYQQGFGTSCHTHWYLLGFFQVTMPFLDSGSHIRSGTSNGTIPVPSKT